MQSLYERKKPPQLRGGFFIVAEKVYQIGFGQRGGFDEGIRKQHAFGNRDL